MSTVWERYKKQQKSFLPCLFLNKVIFLNSYSDKNKMKSSNLEQQPKLEQCQVGLLCAKVFLRNFPPFTRSFLLVFGLAGATKDVPVSINWILLERH